MKNKVLLLLSILICNVAVSFSQTPPPSYRGDILFVSKLIGEYAVPPVVTDAIGEASLALNETMDTMCINITIKGLSGPITGIAIYQGPIGGSGPLVYDLFPFVNGMRVSTVMTGAQLTPTVLAQLFGKELYINVTTATNTLGEIRGPVEPETDFPFMADLTGGQEVPPVPTTATGLAVFDLSRSQISLHIRAIFKNLSGPITGCHLHQGFPGVSGAIVEDLSSAIIGNKLDVIVDPTAYIGALMNGEIYLNVHTSTWGDGEIRGQVLPIQGIAFDTRMDGDQVNPPAPSPAQGLGYMRFSPGRDSIQYDFIFDSLSASVTSAKLIVGGGPSMVDITSGIMSDRLTGTYSGLIPAGFVNEALKGNVYVNLSSASTPTGVLGGRMKKYLREGFTYTIDGTQEVPPTGAAGTGSGMASIDRDMENLHFRMVVNDLTDPVVSAHFHEGAPGESGTVIFDLTPYFSATSTSDAAFNYWMANNGFDSSMAMLFMSGRVYVNVHTPTNLNGEIRGQVVPGGSCFANITGINTVDIGLSELSVYPNPSMNGNVRMSFYSENAGELQLQLHDLTGRILYTKEVMLNAGNNEIVLELNNISSGLYLINLINDKGSSAIRLVRN